MQLVEQHIIDRQDLRFAVIDPACFASKNLYNATLYILRQSFFEHERIPTYRLSAGPNVTHPEQNVPVPNHREVYSQTYPAAPSARGAAC